MDDYTKRLIEQYKKTDKAEGDRRVVGRSVATGTAAGIVDPRHPGFASGNADPIKGNVNWRTELPVLRKRTPAERAESLAQRFWQAVKDHDPAQTELILKTLHEDSWKRGMPISYADVKAVAVELMRRAAAKAGGPY